VIQARAALIFENKESKKNLVVSEDEGPRSSDTPQNTCSAASHPRRIESSTHTRPTTVFKVTESSQVINHVNLAHQSSIQPIAREDFIAYRRFAQIFQKI
jgi:hypothetical protein